MKNNLSVFFNLDINIATDEYGDKDEAIVSTLGDGINVDVLLI